VPPVLMLPAVGQTHPLTHTSLATPPRHTAHTYARTQPIADALAAALASCSRRNLRIVLDAVTTLVDVVGRGPMQQQPGVVQLLMVALSTRWQQPGLTDQVSWFGGLRTPGGLLLACVRLRLHTTAICQCQPLHAEFTSQPLHHHKTTGHHHHNGGA
jgi:hypothetical protein